MKRMRISLIIIFVVVASANLFAAGVPRTFRLQDAQPVTGPTPASNGVTDVSIDGNDIWLGSGKGLSLSTDAGKTWLNYYNTAPFGTEDISAVTTATVAHGGFQNNHVVWVATAHSEVVSSDLQSSSVGVGSGLKYKFKLGSDTVWHSVPQPLDDNTDAFKTIKYGGFLYTALPVVVPQQNLTYDIAVTPSGTVFISSFAGGLRKSTDLGVTWQRVFLPGDGTDSIYPRSDTAYNIELNPVKNFNHRAFSVIALSDSMIFCGTAAGINRSTNGGISWIHSYHKKEKGLSGNFIVALAHQQYSGRSVIWAGSVDADRTADPTEERAASFSNDGGKTWNTAAPLRGTFVHNFGFLGNVVYAASDTGLWCSDDGGLSWTPRNKFLDSARRQQVTQIQVFSAGGRLSDMLLFIGTGDGLVLSTEAGACIGKYTLLHASKTLRSGSETYAFPSPFSPSQEVCRIHYRVADPGVFISGGVTIEVFDFAMHPVRTVCRGAIRDNEREYDEIWNGLTENGIRTANGVYHYSVRVDDGPRRWGKIIVMQ